MLKKQEVAESFAHAQERFKFIVRMFKKDCDIMCVKPLGSFVASEENGNAILKWQLGSAAPVPVASVRISEGKGAKP